ncbi:hypothetical protein MRX96_024925 [Rhipicephalus microplus]
MITHVVVRSEDDDSLRTSPDGTEAAGKTDASAPEEFREKEHAEVKPRIAEEGVDAKGIVERQPMLSMNRSQQQHVQQVLARVLMSRPMPENKTVTESAGILLSTGGRSAANLMRLRCGN